MKLSIQKHKGFILPICFVSLFAISLITVSIFFSIEVQRHALKIEKNITNLNFEVEQIGEYFLSDSLEAQAYADLSYETETIKETGISKLTVSNKDGRLLLTVIKDKENRILVWKKTLIS